MASGSEPVRMPVVSVQGSQAQTPSVTPPPAGKPLPSSGNSSPGAAAQAAAQARNAQDVAAQVALLNKFLNDSGRPDQFRVAPNSDAKLIQEINPANGKVIAEYPSITFPELARSLGISGAVIDALV